MDKIHPGEDVSVELDQIFSRDWLSIACLRTVVNRSRVFCCEIYRSRKDRINRTVDYDPMRNITSKYVLQLYRLPNIRGILSLFRKSSIKYN